MDHKLHKAHILEYQPKNTLSLLQTSSLVYIVSRSWWDYWCKYVGYHDKYTEVSPGPIDNSSLLHRREYSWDTLELKPELDLELDIEVLHPITWKRVIQEYGGGPEISLNVIDGKLDLHPDRYEVLFLDSPCLKHNDKGRQILLSNHLNPKQALESICIILALSASNYNLQIVCKAEGVNNFITMEDDRKLDDYKHLTNLRLAVVLKEPEIGKEYSAIPMPKVMEDIIPMFSSDEEDMQLAMAIQTSLQNRSIEEDLLTSDTEFTGDFYTDIGTSMYQTDLRFLSQQDLEQLHPLNQLGELAVQMDLAEVKYRVSEVIKGPRIRLGIKDLKRINSEMNCLWEKYRGIGKKM